MRILCVVPARIGSTRLPRKPLCLIAGIPLIRLVTEHLLELDLQARIVVAADDWRIVEAVEGLPVDATLTDASHRSGTERVAEIARRAEYAAHEVIVNVQGDEPFVSRDAIQGALGRVLGGDPIGTAAAPLDPAGLENPHRVKVTLDAGGYAVRFSREPLIDGRQHVGVYAYRRPALFDWVNARPVPDELAERLEQIRPMRLGMRIGVAVIREPALPGIDTEEDIGFAEAALSGGVIAA